MGNPAPALLEANAAFYAAFRTADAAAMEAVWARTRPLSCIHPGWPALHGREAVLASWRDILRAVDEVATVTFRDPRACAGHDFGYVLCYEQVGDNLLAATNLFVVEDGAWKLVHHHAGPCAQPIDAPPGTTRH